VALSFVAALEDSNFSVLSDLKMLNNSKINKQLTNWFRHAFVT